MSLLLKLANIGRQGLCIAFVLFACVHTIGWAATVDDAVTVETTWRLQDTQADRVVLGELNSHTDAASLTLVWGEEQSTVMSWFPQWVLYLEVTNIDGQTSQVVLEKSLFTPDADQPYTTKMSYHPGTGIVAVHISRSDSDDIIFSGGVTLPNLMPTLTAKEPKSSQALSVVAHRAISGYKPVADVLSVGRRTESGTLLVSRAFDTGEDITIRLTTPGKMPGRYVATLTPNNGEIVRLGEIPVDGDGRGEITFSAANIPLGEAELHVTYIDAGAEFVSASQRMTIGTADVRVTLHAYDYENGTIRGRISAGSGGSLPGVTYEATVVWAAWPDGNATTIPIVRRPMRELLQEDGIEIDIPLPDGTGVWEMEIFSRTDPTILMRSTDVHDVLYRYPEREKGPTVSREVVNALRPGYERLIDNWLSHEPFVAVTDQASRRIMIMDPAVKDWNAPEAVLWSWAPDHTNGFADVTYRWEKPDEVKIRVNEDGAWMLVTDSSGLAAMIPFPAADDRKWSLMVGGSPHSAELLPDGNIAVAASAGHWVRIYTASQGPDANDYVEHRLEGAHGVSWDPNSELLWALGTYELHALKVTGSPAEPNVELILTSPLPTRGGHDLAPVYGNPDRLWVTSSSRVYQYVKSTNTWLEEYPGAEFIHTMGAVKGIGNQHGGRVFLTQAKGDVYAHATNTVHLFNPQETRVMDGAAFYKVRVLHPDYQ